MRGLLALTLLAALSCCAAPQTAAPAQSSGSLATTTKKPPTARKKTAATKPGTKSATTSGPCTPVNSQVDVQVEPLKKPSCEDEAQAGFRNNYSEPADCVFRWSETSPVRHVKLPVGVAVAGKKLRACRATPETFRFVCFPESQAKNGCEQRVTWPK